MVFNKRGNILDWFLIIPMLLFVAIGIFIAYLIIDNVDGVSIFAENSDAQNGITQAKNAILSFDSLMMFVIVGLSLFVLVSSALVYNHPAFFFFGILLLFIAIIVAGTMSNTFWIFTQDQTIATASALYPKLTFLMENLPLYILFMGFASAISMYVGRNKL